jgi:hypothetical protein
MSEKILQAASMEAAMNDDFTEVEVIQENLNTEIEEEIVTETNTETENLNTETEISAETISTTEEEKVAERIVEVEKVVEKIVEKYPEFKDDHSKALYEAIVGGNEAEVKRYLDQKYKDYNTMSDIDVVKEGLKATNPKWTDKDIEIEIKSKYGNLTKKDLTLIDEENEPEEYEKAVRYNEQIEARELLLSRDARDARYTLDEKKLNVELPKITTETKQPEVNEPTPEEIAEAAAKWIEDVEKHVPEIQDYKFKVDGEEVIYKLTEEDRKGQVEFMKTFDGGDWAAKRGWINEDGTQNVMRIAEDVHKLENIERIIASSATQIKTATKKEVIKDIKNLDLDGNSRTVQVKVKSFADAALDA